jgi:hypothetical protein
MCRNIKPLFNFDPPATDAEIHDAATQFVRKLSGFTKPSAANQAAFDQAIEAIAHDAHHLIDALVTTAPTRDREIEAAHTRARSAQRFGATQ